MMKVNECGRLWQIWRERLRAAKIDEFQSDCEIEVGYLGKCSKHPQKYTP